MAKKQTYGNESITSLKGADRVRLRPAVIFGSDGIDGCQHSIFEILSNSIDEILVEMQFDLLRKKAASGESFVIVGRCAEELFRGEERLGSVFVVADMEDRVKNVAEQHKISPTEARAKIYRHDQGRKKYHNRYSSVKWGDSRGYDVCINSSRLGIEGTAKALEAYIAARLEQRKA